MSGLALVHGGCRLVDERDQIAGQGHVGGGVVFFDKSGNPDFHNGQFADEIAGRGKKQTEFGLLEADRGVGPDRNGRRFAGFAVDSRGDVQGEDKGVFPEFVDPFDPGLKLGAQRPPESGSEQTVHDEVDLVQKVGFVFRQVEAGNVHALSQTKMIGRVALVDASRFGVQNNDLGAEIPEVPGQGESVTAVVAGSGHHDSAPAAQRFEMVLEHAQGAPAGIFHEDFAG